jgi:heat shock protein HslJ
MKRLFAALLAAGFAFGAVFAAQAKDKAAAKEKEQKETQEAIPAYKPFPHNFMFVLKEINGKTPPVDMWIRIDSTMRGAGFSGCKNWSTVFAVGANRLGPKAMPALTNQKCDPALEALEREYWSVLMSGPYWDTQGSDLILKGFKGGVMRFTRSL